MTLELALVFLRWATPAGMVLTCLRLLRCRLHRRYRVFFAFLLFSSVRTAVLLAYPIHTAGYMKIWVLTEPVLWVFYILLVLELYSLILEGHKGLYTLGRWAMYAASVAAFLVSIASLFAPADGAQRSRLMPFYLMTERGLLASLLLFLFLLLAFLSRYPLTLSRNAIVHSIVYSVFFLTLSIAFLLRSIFGMEISDSMNTLLTALRMACTMAWLFLLNARGENRKVVLHAPPAGQEEFLVRQLNQINATVMRAARK
jgi:hypothetical protein